MKKAMRKRQRGATIVEMLVIIGIMGIITPTLTLVITTLLASPQSAHANLTSTHDANYAGAFITRDANCAEEWIEDYPAITGKYGTFKWEDLDGNDHAVLYHYSDGALLRQETIDDGEDVTVGPDMIIAQGLVDEGGDQSVDGVEFEYDDIHKSVTVTIRLAQNDARGDPVTVERTFHAWMRAAVGADTWGFRREINLYNGSDYNLTDYPMLLDLTGPYNGVDQFGLQWDFKSEWLDRDIQENGEDIRFVRHVLVYELPLTISTPADSHQVRVLIDSTDIIGDNVQDEVILGHMAPPNYDGSDVRFFREQPLDAGGNLDKGAIYDPSDERKLSFWVQERTDTSFIAWVNVPSADITEIYMYYGDPSRPSESSAADTFTSTQFTDPFPNLAESLIDETESENFVINGEEVEIDLATGTIPNGDFMEDPNTSWTVTRTNVALTSDLHNIDCETLSGYCAKLWKPNKWDWVWADQYIEISQTIDLTGVSGICFDANLFQSTAGIHKAYVYLDNDIDALPYGGWEQDLPTASGGTTISAEVTKLNGTELKDIDGNHTLRLRVNAEVISWNADFIAYFTNIRATQFAEVTSDGFPDVAGVQFAMGDQITWNDTTLPGTTDILYRVYGYDGSAWGTDPIPDSLIPGNSAGFSQSPIDISGILPTSGYEKIRLQAMMYSSDSEEIVTPALDDWTADYYTRSASDPETTYTTDDDVATARFELLPFHLDTTDQEESAEDPDIWDPNSSDNDDRGNVKLWVNISYIPIGDSKIYVYYGNDKAGTLPDGFTDYEDAVGKYFHDPFDDWSLIDTDDTHHVTVNGGQVEVVLANDVVADPMFQTGDPWMFFDNEDDMKGDFFNETCHLYTQSSDEDEDDDQLMFVRQGNYVECVQEVDLTDVHTLSFDYDLWSQTDVFLLDYKTYQAQVWAGDQVIWSMVLPEGSSTPPDSRASIDISGYGFDGTYALKFRVQCTYARFILIFPYTTRHFEAFFDNIETVGYQDGITLASVAFPEQAMNISDGFLVNWLDDCPQKDVKYQIQYDLDGDLATSDWTPLENDMFLGSNQNTAGFYTKDAITDGMPPVHFIPKKNWDHVTWLRIYAWIEISDPGHVPTIQDWSVKFKPAATVPPSVAGPIEDPREPRSDELPISVYSEDHDVAAGTVEVQLDNLPVFDYFMNVRIDDLPTTQYDLDAAAGLITLHAAREDDVVVSVDYLYEM